MPRRDADTTERDGDAASSVTDEQIDAVMLAAQALVGVTVHSLTELEDRVTLPQLRALVLVSSRASLNMNALAQLMDIHPANATRACDRLVTAGLLERRESPDDRRNLLLEVTDDGRALIDTLVDHRRRAIGEVLEQLSESRRRSVAAAMRSFGAAAGQETIGQAWKLAWPN